MIWFNFAFLHFFLYLSNFFKKCDLISVKTAIFCLNFGLALKISDHQFNCDGVLIQLASIVFRLIYSRFVNLLKNHPEIVNMVATILSHHGQVLELHISAVERITRWKHYPSNSFVRQYVVYENNEQYGSGFTNYALNHSLQ